MKPASATSSLSCHPPQSLVKPGTTRDKKKNRSAQQPLQDGPLRRVLGSARVPLRSLLKRPQKVRVLCDFGVLGGESEAEATRPGSVARVDPDQCRVYDSIQEDNEGPRESGRGEGSSVLSEGPFSVLNGKKKKVSLKGDKLSDVILCG